MGWLLLRYLLVQGIIIWVISVYASQCGLDESQKDDFYDRLINIARKLGKGNCSYSNRR